MDKLLVKNRRFKEGKSVDILHSPVYEGNTVAISDSTSGSTFSIVATMENDISTEQFKVNDIAAFGFGAGVITAISGRDVTVGFPNSMFPNQNVMRYVGTEFQNVLFFVITANQDAVAKGFYVGKYTEEVKQATFGYTKNVYNLETDAELVLVPVRRQHDGVLSALMISKGFVLKSCDDELYDTSAGWLPDFPLELSGTSIDPIYRRAFLKKRKIESDSLRAKSSMTFKLIG